MPRRRRRRLGVCKNVHVVSMIPRTAGSYCGTKKGQSSGLDENLHFVSSAISVLLRKATPPWEKGKTSIEPAS